MREKIGEGNGEKQRCIRTRLEILSRKKYISRRRLEVRRGSVGEIMSASHTHAHAHTENRHRRKIYNEDTEIK